MELLESIRIEDLEQKKLYLDKQSKLVQNQQLQDLSCQINTLQKAADRLEEVNTIDLFGNYIISWLMMPQINSALNSNRFLRLR